MIGLRDINFNIFATTTIDFGDIHFFWEHDDVESRAMELKTRAAASAFANF